MAKVGLLFPGQGSQYVKMMAGVKDIPAVKERCGLSMFGDHDVSLYKMSSDSVQDMLEKANNMLDFNLLDLCLKGPEPELELLGKLKGR